MLLAFLLPQLARVWIIIDFRINQEFIADVLCINKNDPSSMCNGKCYLSKQLKKIEVHEKEKMPNSFQERLPITVYIPIQKNDDFLLLAPLKDCNRNTFFETSGLYISSYVNEIFHPPKLALI